MHGALKYLQTLSLAVIFIIPIVESNLGLHDRVDTNTSGPSTGSDETPSREKIPPQHPQFTYLGYLNGTYLWISKHEANNYDAEDDCSLMWSYWNITLPEQFYGFKFTLLYLTDENELQSTGEILSAYERNNSEFLKTVWILWYDPMDPYFENHTKSVEMLDFDANFQRRKRLSQGLKTLVTTSEEFSRSKRQLGINQLTHLETHYPWLEAWKNAKQVGCEAVKICEPIKCDVTTGKCELQPGNCSITKAMSCDVVQTVGCTAICENCAITVPPDCWMGKSKCIIQRERTCKMTPPSCTTSTPPCIITRPPCVTKQSPCNIDVTPKPECKLPPACGISSGVKCDTYGRDCYPEEVKAGKESCSYEICEPKPVCMTPEYCREGNGTVTTLACPTPTTFCPPEIVKCPPPEVTCGEPKLECTDPVVYCPPPTVICSQPQVTCSSPQISCPNVITSCQNPDFKCNPPAVTCPTPQLKCSEPKPCFLPSDQKPICGSISPPEENCTDPRICRCMILRNPAPPKNHWNAKFEDCLKPYRFICTAKCNHRRCKE